MSIPQKKQGTSKNRDGWDRLPTKPQEFIWFESKQNPLWTWQFVFLFLVSTHSEPKKIQLNREYWDYRPWHGWTIQTCSTFFRGQNIIELCHLNWPKSLAPSKSHPGHLGQLMAMPQSQTASFNLEKPEKKEWQLVPGSTHSFTIKNMLYN